jgi:hypothetical protein
VHASRDGEIWARTIVARLQELTVPSRSHGRWPFRTSPAIALCAAAWSRRSTNRRRCTCTTKTMGRGWSCSPGRCRPSKNAKMSPLAQVAINGFAWVDHGMGYSFVESPPTEALHPMPMRRAARSPPTPEPQAPRASGCALNGARPSPGRRARDPSGGVEAACDRLSVPLGHRAHRRRGSAAAASPPRSSERRPLLGKLASHRACRG